MGLYRAEYLIDQIYILKAVHGHKIRSSCLSEKSSFGESTVTKLNHTVPDIS